MLFERACAHTSATVSIQGVSSRRKNTGGRHSNVKLRRPVESAALSLGVVLVNENDLDAARTRHPHVLYELLSNLAHKRPLVEVEEHCVQGAQERGSEWSIEL